MKKLQLDFSEVSGSHPIWIGNEILGQLGSLLKKTIPPGKGFVIADDRLRNVAEDLVVSLEKSRWKLKVIFVTVSESLKEFKNIYPLYGELLRLGADRDSVIFALGGGVVGDIAGFVAGTYLRGIRWVGVPSTLLAQVDSSVGGKTGVNHSLGKNLIGVFHQPSAVICDTALLRTLTFRDRLSGLGEMIKIGLTFDPVLYQSLVMGWQDLLTISPGSPPFPSTWERPIEKCLLWKSKMVKEDLRDTLGMREALNFGHTLGHALEAESKYGTFRHGEAVILGMRMANLLAVSRGHLKAREHSKIDAFLSVLPVPKIPKSVKTVRLIERLKWDKKSKNQQVRFVLLQSIGKVILDSGVKNDEVQEAIESFRK